MSIYNIGCTVYGRLKAAEEEDDFISYESRKYLKAWVCKIQTEVQFVKDTPFSTYTLYNSVYCKCTLYSTICIFEPEQNTLNQYNRYKQDFKKNFLCAQEC